MTLDPDTLALAPLAYSPGKTYSAFAYGTDESAVLPTNKKRPLSRPGGFCAHVKRRQREEREREREKRVQRGKT